MERPAEKYRVFIASGNASIGNATIFEKSEIDLGYGFFDTFKVNPNLDCGVGISK